MAEKHVQEEQAKTGNGFVEKFFQFLTVHRDEQKQFGLLEAPIFVAIVCISWEKNGKMKRFFLQCRIFEIRY